MIMWIDNHICPTAVQELSGRETIFPYVIIDKRAYPQIEEGNPRSHGTVCAAILAQAMPKLVELITLSASLYDNKVTIENLCTALEYCLQAPPAYLSLSIGTSNWLGISELSRLTKKLSDTGTHIFAACANDGHLALPAAYPWVTGVRYEPGISGFYREENSPIGSNLVVGDFTTPVLEKLEKENSFFECRTNSMAAPYALGKMLSENWSIEELPLWKRYEPTQRPLELPMPVVALWGSMGKMKELLLLFQQENYQAALLTDRYVSDWGCMIMCIKPDAFWGWAKSLEKAGILFLDMEGLLSSSQKYVDYTVSLNHKDVWTAYNDIVNFFGREKEDAKRKI